MKIEIKKQSYTKAYFNWLSKEARNPKKNKLLKPKEKTKLVSETVEIPNELVAKTIAVIDELLDRTCDDWEEKSWTDIDFPLVPFPFFEKNRLPENIGVDDYWISYWLDTRLMNTILERAKIIEILAGAQTLKIKHHPVVNNVAGIFNGDAFNLSIERDKLSSLRKIILENQQKITNEKSSAVKPPIRKTALQNIASVIAGFATHGKLSDFFVDFHFPPKKYIKGSKYDRVFSILSWLYETDPEMLLPVIEEATHPLRFFGGDEEMALQIQDLFSSFLQFDGYCMHNGKIVRATPELLKEIKSRIEKRRREEVRQNTGNIAFMPTQEPFQIRIVEGNIKTEVEGLKEGLNKIAKTKKQEKKKQQVRKTTLYLNQSGNLYRVPKEKYCYPMSESEGRHKIVRYFVENKIYNYYPTRELSVELGKDETSLMKEIGKINSITQGRLAIKGRILEGKKGSGYRISPNYKITIKND